MGTSREELDYLVARLLPLVLERLQAESTGVSEIEMTDSLDGIVSLPVIKRIGGTEKIVEVLIETLAKPVEDSASEYATAAEEALAAAAKANLSAESLDALKPELTAAIEEALNASDSIKSSIISASNAAGRAEAGAEEAEEAAEAAREAAQHPTYIGEDYFVYEWDKETKEYIKTDIIVKGEPGSGFRVVARYPDLAALSTAHPNGGDGFFEVGVSAPYEYYYWNYSSDMWANSGPLQGAKGDSAYGVALQNGFAGTEEEWLASLQGTKGDSAYKVAVENGFAGTEEEWLASLHGSDGKTAYQAAQEGGFTGTEDEFNTSIASIGDINAVLDELNGEVL